MARSLVSSAPSFTDGLVHVAILLLEGLVLDVKARSSVPLAPPARRELVFACNPAFSWV